MCVVLKTHLLKMFRFLYRNFVSILRISQNKQKPTQQLIQTN